MKRVHAIVLLAVPVVGCVSPPPQLNSPIVPALEYSRAVRGATTPASSVVPYEAGLSRRLEQQAAGRTSNGELVNAAQFQSPAGPAREGESRAQLRFASDEMPPDSFAHGGGHGAGGASLPPALHSSNQPSGLGNDVYVYRSRAPEVRDYRGPLALGDPGSTASLWRESRGANELFRDYRAFQVMDLVTIVVTENTQGNKEAKTESKSKSTISATIEALLGLDDSFTDSNRDAGLNPALSAETQNDFKGEGKTERKGSLKGKISAMVVEVLPNGILRIEGEKIVSVNNEEQVMVISGLVRPFDISAVNEVDSSKVANMRIDYYGTGTVGETQYGGWLGRIMRVLWPF